MNRNKGSVLIIGLLVVVVVLAAVAFVLLKRKTIVSDGNYMMNGSMDDSTMMSPEPSPVSESTDVNVLKQELNDTSVIPVDQEFKDLNTSASSL